jgi:DNA polymerase-3 subunit delta'
MRFRDIIGQRQVTALLSRAVAHGTLPPSLLFTGPSGVGKASTAGALAQVLNCEQPAGAEGSGAIDSCGECAACRRLARAVDAFREGADRQAIDCLLWLAPDEKGSIKIDPVRDALGRAAYRPFDGRERVIVIDGAEALEVAAQQALLKMLEEPPAATRFTLVTAQPDVLLPTIRSRCPQLRFGPLAPAGIATALIERHGWAPAEAQAAAAGSDGSYARALRQRDGASTRARDIAAGVLEHVAGSRGPLGRLEAAPALVARDEGTGRKGDAGRSRSGTVTRMEMSARLDAMGALLRDIGILTSRADRRRLANADLSSWLDGMAPAFAGDRLTRAFAAVDRARLALERNAGQKVVADWLVLNL